MSAKARDGQGRWRCKTIGVRVSPGENAEIDALAALSGMSKQDYCICRMLQRDVVVVGNPRVHKALKIQMEQLCHEFSKLCSVNDVSAEALHVLEYLTELYKGLELKRDLIEIIKLYKATCFHTAFNNMTASQFFGV